MNVVAIADMHGRLPDNVPVCDVLVLAGDICPDFGYGIPDHDIARAQQEDWLRGDYFAWEQQVPAVHIIATPGNHDRVSAFPAACRSKMFIDEGATIDGKTFWLTPWVDFCGPWNYMLGDEQRRQRFMDIPADLDLLVSHGPMYGVLDLAYGDVNAGCKELRAAVDTKRPRQMVCGHIHEARRYGKTFQLGSTTVHQVSMWGMNWTPTVLTV